MIFSFCGVKVEITFLFVAFIAFILSLQAPMNVIVTILSSLMHEFGHLVMMAMIGHKPQKIKFEITGINIIRNQNTNISIKNEILISLGGPVANALILMICCIIMSYCNGENVMTVACINLILMVFNLLPINKLDGGMALYYLLSRKFQISLCLKILRITSVFLIFLIYLWGIYVFISNGYNISLIIIAIFLTLSVFSDNEY